MLVKGGPGLEQMYPRRCCQATSLKPKLTPIYVAIPRHELGYIELRKNMLTKQDFHQLIMMVNLDTVVYEIGDTPLYHPDLL